MSTEPITVSMTATDLQVLAAQMSDADTVDVQLGPCHAQAFHRAAFVAGRRGQPPRDYNGRPLFVGDAVLATGIPGTVLATEGAEATVGLTTGRSITVLATNTERVG